MSGFQNFAVAGAGAIGINVVKALLETKKQGRLSEVRILTRSPEKHKDLVAEGATIATVDYSSQASLASALSNIDVVVSTVGHEAFKLQADLAEAAKAANVQLFVPSEFGVATAGLKKEDIPPIFGTKEAIRERLHEIGLPYAIFYTGLIPDYVAAVPWFANGLGLDFVNKKFQVAGSGEGLGSFTGSADIGRFLSYVLTSLPKDQLLWKIFKIEGDRMTFKSLVEGYLERTGGLGEVKHRPLAEVEAALASNPYDLFSTILLATEKGIWGTGVVGKPEELDNNAFPDWNPSKATDLIIANLKK